MQIDLFTFVAQIINFIILLVLLRLVLYKPVVNAMNEREQKIKARLEEAEAKRQQADREAERYREQRAEIDAERERVLADARQEAEQRREHLLHDARREVDERRQQWHDALAHEKDRFLRDLQRRAETSMIAAMRQALSDLADAELESQMIRTLTRQLDRQRDDLIESLNHDHGEVVVYSAFDLTDNQREQIRSALNARLPSAASPRFERDDDLICGVALRVGSYRIGWNLDQYLDALERDLRATFDDTIEPDNHELKPA